jgi:hypothetical protein
MSFAKIAIAAYGSSNPVDMDARLELWLAGKEVGMSLPERRILAFASGNGPKTEPRL